MNEKHLRAVIEESGVGHNVKKVTSYIDATHARLAALEFGRPCGILTHEVCRDCGVVINYDEHQEIFIMRSSSGEQTFGFAWLHTYGDNDMGFLL